MTALTLPAFNPLTFANRLKDAGTPAKQAETEAEVLHEALTVQSQAVSTLGSQVQSLSADRKRDTEQMATKGNISEVRAELNQLRSEMEVRFARIEGELKLIRWMLGTLMAIGVTSMAGMASLVIKAFF